MGRVRTAVLLLLGGWLAGAGELPAQIVTLGVKGGVNVADVSVDAEETLDTENITGFVGGAFLRMGGPVFALQPEALYSHKGFSTGDLDGIDGELNLGYFEVPVLLTARLPAPLVRPFGYVGPIFSFEVSCDVEGESGTISVSTACEEVDVQTRSTDVGIGVGGGLDLSLGRASIIGEVRYNIGLRDIGDDEGDPDSVKNRVWSLMAGIGFPIL